MSARVIFEFITDRMSVVGCAMLSIICEPFACVIAWFKNLMGRAIESRCIAAKNDKNEATSFKSSVTTANRRDDNESKNTDETKTSKTASEMNWNDYF
ncbi:unnamed protein product [Chrysodeixis includens]|uniref:Uncharacterized protein n=1 Tax=Chrysodeixis includens TaxID=689277 RepID=A0A9P0BIQ9_CHRIL|nr:unnamed protein product [Chrysodeixis includens]